MWVAGLGALAAVLALLSLITRTNSRHPLLIIGLFALGITFLSWRIMPRAAGERASTMRRRSRSSPKRRWAPSRSPRSASASMWAWSPPPLLVGFGLTIVVKRAGQAYVVASPDDDV